MFLSVAGTYLLCRPTGGASLNAGDICLLLAASFFAIHILLIDRYSYLDSIQFCCVQLFIAGFFSIIAALYCHDPLSISGLIGAALLLLYCGIVSIGMGYTVQIYAQKFLHPAACAIILSCEAFYAVLGGWLFLHEKLTLREFTGGSMIFIAIVLAQIFSSKSSNSKKENQSTQEESLEEKNTTN
jgi:drug/metabolite transporter (DMT)-like permease